MKRIVKVIAITFLFAAVITVVFFIENSRMSPMERFLESSQTTMKADNYIPVKITNNGKNLQYEFLSYELVDDKDIEKQTKYNAEYFLDGKVPPADYIVEYIDHDAMARDYPKYDEFRKSDSENKKGMTYEEADDFVREHEAEYRSYKHVKTKYLFVRCRITYIGNGRNEEWLSNFKVFAMRDNTMIGMSYPNCYFDHPQHKIGEDRQENFFIYRFERIGDSLECVLGCRLRGDRFDLSEGNKYYLGFQPIVEYSDYDQFNPAIDSRCVALDDLPKED